MREPHFGHTRRGMPVHARTIDHHSATPGSRWPVRFNAWLAVKISQAVGSMWCAYVFALLALLSLPAVLTAAGFTHFFPHWLVAAGLIALVAWIAQTFLQLVLLSVIMVGQGVMGKASDARSAKTFEDAEETRKAMTVALDRLDETTEGGIKAILDAVSALAKPQQQAVQMNSAITLDGDQIKQLVAEIQANASAVVAPPKTAAKRLATATERGKAAGK
jgi:hypothetical protein